MTHSSVVTDDLLPEGSEGLITQEQLVTIEFEDIACEVKQNGSSASVFREALRVLKVILLGFFILGLIVTETGGEELFEIPGSES